MSRANRNKDAMTEEIDSYVGRKNTRKGKLLSQEGKPESKEKFEEQHKITPLNALTQNQKKAMKAFNDGKQLIILSGAAGTGKSLLSAYYAAKAWREGKVNQIILIRSLVSTGVSCGSLPGDIKQKYGPALAAICAHLEKFLGAATVKYCLEKEIIKFMPLDFIRGSSFENQFLIVEEAQNCTTHEVMSIVTRIGEGSTMVLNGDPVQSDLRIRNKVTGIEYISNIVEKYSYNDAIDEDSQEQLRSNVEFVEFTNDDVVRSGLTKAFVKAFNIESEGV